MTVLDTGTEAREDSASSPRTTRTSLPPDLETAVIRIVEQDPFASIREIKTEVNNRPGTLTTTWRQVFSILRQRKLLTKRSRFRYILGRR